MPAIELARLRTKSNEIAGLIDEPKKFISAATTLFEFYADQTRKKGLKSMPASVTPAYLLPKPVIRRLKYELKNVISEKQEAALVLADELWHLTFIEFKEISVFLLGNLTLNDVNDVVLRLKKWNIDTTDENVQKLIASDGTKKLRLDYPKEFKELCFYWLRLEEDVFQRTGLFMLEDLIIEQQFDALPIVFSILRREIHSMSNLMFPYYRDLFKIIIPLSQPEATYFLRQQVLIQNDNPQINRLIRQSIPMFDEEYQLMLQKSIK